MTFRSAIAPIVRPTRKTQTARTVITSNPNSKPLLARTGPAIIVAAVVCGPGSILTSSKIGDQLGYSAIWVLVLACALMIAMVNLAMRIGVSFEGTPCQEIADRLGRPVAIAIGVVMFLIIASFQTSNNIAIAASAEAIGWDMSERWALVALLAINLAVIGFLYLGRHLYRLVEKMMKALVLVMLIAFVINCIVAQPSLSKVATGLIPSSPGPHAWLLVALVGTTFSVAAAFYQAYLVREKDWSVSDIKTGTFDSITGIATLGFISLVIMVTSAAVFGSNPESPDLESASQVAAQLKPVFGTWAQIIFGVGIFAGAISSFLVNALIGGHILADGCGIGERIDSPWTRHLTVLVLLTSMVVSILSISTGMSRVTLIVMAQALTVVGFPGLALVLIYLGIQQRREKKAAAIPIVLLVAAIIGLIVTGVIATNTVGKVADTISGLLSGE